MSEAHTHEQIQPSAPREDLRVTRVRFESFRNYKTFELSNIGSLTVFTGCNAVGKTNLVEGIELLTAVSSFRNPTAAELIHWEEKQASLSAHVSGAGRELDIALTVQDNHRHYTLNGKKKTQADLKGLLPAVVFTPDDLNLVKGSNTNKRAAIDFLGVQLSPNYIQVKKDYEKTLQHKNKLLKEAFSPVSQGYLEAIDETLITVGVQLYRYRRELFERLRAEIQRSYANIVGGAEMADLQYRASWDKEPRDKEDRSPEVLAEQFYKALQIQREEERRRGHAIIGPHADKIDFYIQGKNARVFASQGQQRSLVLSFKLAEVAVLHDSLSQNPVLLLDDVMSELDEYRRSALVHYVLGDIQTFITTANVQYFSDELLEAAQVVELGERRG